jgi:outer membrane protein assembly factor BamB
MITSRLLSPHVFTVVKVSLFVFLCSSLNLYAQNWPMANGNRERTSWAQFETVLNPPLEKTIEFPLSGYESGMSFHNNTLFVSVELDPNRVIAFNPNDTTELWHFEIPNTMGSVNVVPAVNDSIVLCGGQHGLGLYALDRFTGNEKWFKELGSLYSVNPMIDSNRVYIVIDSLYCLDIADSSTIWTFPFGLEGTPVIDEDNVYICGNRKLICLDKINGNMKWQIYNSKWSYSSFCIDDNFIYTNSNDSILAITKDSGSVYWVYKNNDGQLPEFSVNSIAISDSFLCFVIWEDSVHKGQLHTLDKITGNHIWQHTFDTTGVYPPTIANGIVYAVNWKSKSVWGFDLQTGDSVFYDDSEPYLHQPIVADGKLYVGAFRKVVAFKNVGTGVSSNSFINQESFKLFPNYPNPFNPSTTISFFLPREDFVKLVVYNIEGQEVKMLINDELSSGLHKTVFDASNLASGIYFYKIITSEFSDTKKLALIR